MAAALNTGAITAGEVADGVETLGCWCDDEGEEDATTTLGVLLPFGSALLGSLVGAPGSVACGDDGVEPGVAREPGLGAGLAGAAPLLLARVNGDGGLLGSVAPLRIHARLTRWNSM